MVLSVRFFKRLILVALALCIVIPTVTALALRVSLSKERAALDEASHQLELTQEQLKALLEGEDIGSVGGASPSDLDSAEAMEYQELFPELYSPSQLTARRVKAENTVYLTFEDSPSTNTRAILDALDQAEVKATFFVSAHQLGEEETAELLREIRDRGHTIGIGTYSNDYLQIYASVEAYLADFDAMYQLVEEATGVKAELFRFPGGSVNSYNSRIYQRLIAEMLRRGFVFYDWNATGGDTLKDADAESVVRTVKADMNGKSRGFVLLHDSGDKDFVVQALPQVISMLREQGYSFAPLSIEVLPIVFSYKSQT